MFLKHMIITNQDGLIRDIKFHQGMNLIIDDTDKNTQRTGNNVGKTSVLRLIDFCLGGDAKDIYTSTEGNVNETVRDFLVDTDVEVELSLIGNIDMKANRVVVIRRNFQSRQKALYEINGKKYQRQEFCSMLQYAMWGIQTVTPDFRQIISHSMRIDTHRMEHPLKTITGANKELRQEATLLYMFGVQQEDSEKRLKLRSSISQNQTFKNRLEKDATLSALRTKLSFIERNIRQLNEKKEALHLNPDFEKDLDTLVDIKRSLNQLVVVQSNLELRRQLITDAVREMNSMSANVQSDEVANIYKQAKAFGAEIHHTFENLLKFHNEMLLRKLDFMTLELPQIEKELDDCTHLIDSEREREDDLNKKLNLSISYEKFDELITKLNQMHQEKGAIEQRIAQIVEIQDRIKESENELEDIDKGLFADEQIKFLQTRLEEFNYIFASISYKLYEKAFGVQFDVAYSRDGKPIYKFSTMSSGNFSSGVKKGEATCFDLAYVKFADKNRIPCLHFILNDKEELLHDNQLLIISQIVGTMKNVQYVSSILRGKLPEGFEVDKYKVLTLSEDNRLFKIENKK